MGFSHRRPPSPPHTHTYLHIPVILLSTVILNILLAVAAPLPPLHLGWQKPFFLRVSLPTHNNRDGISSQSFSLNYTLTHSCNTPLVSQNYNKIRRLWRNTWRDVLQVTKGQRGGGLWRRAASLSCQLRPCNGSKRKRKNSMLLFLYKLYFLSFLWLCSSSKPPMDPPRAALCPSPFICLHN